FLRPAEFRLRVVADRLRRDLAGDVGLALPDVPVQAEDTGAVLAAGLDEPDAHRRARRGGEHGGGRITADAREAVRHRVGRIDLAGLLQHRARIEAEAEPHRLAPVVDRHVAGVLSVLGTATSRGWRTFVRGFQAPHRTDGVAVLVAQIDAALVED